MHFLVIGAGIGGLATAQALLRQKHTLQVFEAAPELREIGAGVVLGANAMRALHLLGLHEAVRPLGYPVTHVDLRDRHGRVLNSTDTTPFTRRLGFDNIGIHRAALQRALLDQLPEGTVQLNKQLKQFTQTPSSVTAHFADGSTATADALIGADGIRSPVRLQLLPQSQPRYAGYTCWRAVVDASSLQLPAGHSNETWGGTGRFGYVPLANGQVYWFACVNSAEPQNPQYRAFTLTDVRRYFADYHSPIPELLDLTRPDQLLWNDIIDIKPIRRFAYDRVLLLGDAAHATTPNLGQGAGQAVEDAATLAACLDSTSTVAEAFRAFEKRRLPRTTRVVNLSWLLGKAAQLRNPLLTSLRDAVMRGLPPRVNRQQMAFLYETDL